ncbi:LuxR C-terminal-related transcriptional regulator [Knoellia sp. CPCC 206450]|uniref:LuxR C-terminal-related transcriptional regulator n=1 Tax=Knoellia tibetensis TaxID=3404798 RepID=UPI003B428449
MRPVATRIRVVVADNQEVYRHGVRAALEDERDLDLVAEAGSLDHTIHAVRSVQPDILLLEPSMSGVPIREAIERVKAVAPRMRVLVLTDSDAGEGVVENLRAGASGHLLESSPVAELLVALRRTHEGHAAVAAPLVGHLMAELHRLAREQADRSGEQGSALTRREAQVLHWIGRGKSNPEIGRELSLSEHTVKNHVRTLYKKLGVRSRTAAATLAFRQGLG